MFEENSMSHMDDIDSLTPLCYLYIQCYKFTMLQQNLSLLIFYLVPAGCSVYTWWIKKDVSGILVSTWWTTMAWFRALFHQLWLGSLRYLFRHFENVCTRWLRECFQCLCPSVISGIPMRVCFCGVPAFQTQSCTLYTNGESLR